MENKLKELRMQGKVSQSAKIADQLLCQLVPIEAFSLQGAAVLRNAANVFVGQQPLCQRCEGNGSNSQIIQAV